MDNQNPKNNSLLGAEGKGSKDNFAINSIKEAINVNLKSIYRVLLKDNTLFEFKITDDIYYGYIFVVKGRMSICTVQDYTFDVLEGQAVFVWSKDIRSYTMHEDEAQFYWVWFSLNGTSLPLMNVFDAGLTGRDLEKINRCIRLIRRKTSIDLTRANIIFIKYILDGLEKIQDAAIARDSHHRITILKSTDYIRENICELPTVPEIANLFGMSFKQYRKHFVRYVGVYPAKYIYTQKLLFSQDYLINTNLNINLISDMLGFYSPFYFSRCFKKEFGCSPSEYRKKYGKQN